MPTDAVRAARQRVSLARTALERNPRDAFAAERLEWALLALEQAEAEELTAEQVAA